MHGIAPQDEAVEFGTIPKLQLENLSSYFMSWLGTPGHDAFRLAGTALLICSLAAGDEAEQRSTRQESTTCIELLSAERTG